MTYLVKILRKKLILEKEIASIQRLLNDAYIECDLIREHDTKADKEEIIGGDKQARSDLLSKIIILYERFTETEAGGHEKPLPQCKYYLDAPAHRLQEAYVDYLDCIFHGYVTPEKTSKKDPLTQEDIIDNSHVYVKEILIRLFTAAISVDKNNSKLGKEAHKIIDCLELFLTKINKTALMYDKPFFSFSTQVSNINIAFASEHKEWLYLLRKMQQIIESMHKHTATVSSLLETLKKTKTVITLQLIAYMSKGDTNQEKLSPEWIKYTLLDCEMEYLKKEKENSNAVAITSDIPTLYKLASENYSTTSVNEHQRKTMLMLTMDNQNNNNINIKKIRSLYELLAKTNVLLAILDQIDILFSTTGWVLIVCNVLDMSGLSKLIDNLRESALTELKFDMKVLSKTKTEIKKSLMANGAISGIDFAKDLSIASKGIKDLESGIIKSCVVDIVKGAIGTLQSLQQHLNCNLVNEKELISLMGKDSKVLNKASNTPPQNTTSKFSSYSRRRKQLNNINQTADDKNNDFQKMQEQINSENLKLVRKAETIMTQYEKQIRAAWVKENTNENYKQISNEFILQWALNSQISPYEDKTMITNSIVLKQQVENDLHLKLMEENSSHFKTTPWFGLWNKHNTTTQSPQRNYRETPFLRNFSNTPNNIARLLVMPNDQLICGLEAADSVNHIYCVQLWNLKTQKCLQTFEICSAGVTSLIWLSNDDILVNTWFRRLFRVDKRTYQLNLTSRNLVELDIADVFNLQKFPDDTILYFSKDRKFIIHYDLKFKIEKNQFNEDVDRLSVLSSDTFASVNKDSVNNIQIWNRNHSKSLRTLTGHLSGVFALQGLPDKLLASGSADKTIRIYNTESGECTKILSGHSGAIKMLTLLPKNFLASVATDSTIRIWDYKTGQCVQVLQTEEQIDALAVTSEGNLVTGSNKSIHIYAFPELKFSLKQESHKTESESYTTTATKSK